MRAVVSGRARSLAAGGENGRTPQVSIGLAVYNGERFLSDTLESILSQTFADFELIISDNGSTDRTQEICLGYAVRDLRIRYHRSAVNVGVSENFNRVFRLATAPYFRWASADDLFAPTSVMRCIEVLDEHPEVVLCYPKTLLIDEGGAVIGAYEDGMDLRAPSSWERLRLAIEHLHLVNVHYGLIRSDALRRTRLMERYPGSDLDLIMELTMYGQFWEIPEPLFFRRMHSGASSQIKDQERLEQFYDPSNSTHTPAPYWRHLRQRLVRIVCGAVPTSEKLRLIGVLLRHGIASRDVLVKELLRTSAGLAG